jgi:nucleotide-binding universal stress UspA family protein
MYKHILVALDGSANAEVVLPYAEALASKFDSRVTLLRATTPAVDLIPPGAIGMVAGDLTAYGRVPPQIAYDEAEAVMDAESKEAAAYLTGLADRLTQQGIRAQVDITNARASEAILRRADELGADLVAMTTHGRSGLARALLGSVADEVVRRSNVPVLLVRVTGDAGDLPREGEADAERPDTTDDTTNNTVGGDTNG